MQDKERMAVEDALWPYTCRLPNRAGALKSAKLPH